MLLAVLVRLAIRVGVVLRSSDEVKKQGFRADATTKNVTISEVSALRSGSISWGQNSKGVAQRARKYLGWEPKGLLLEETIVDLVKSEAKALGL